MSNTSKSILRSLVERKMADQNDIARVLNVSLAKVAVWLSLMGPCDLPEAKARKAQSYFELMHKRQEQLTNPEKEEKL